MDSLLALLPWTALSGLIVGSFALYGQGKISRRAIEALKESRREIIASQQTLVGTARLSRAAGQAGGGLHRLHPRTADLPDIDPTQESMKQIAEYIERLEEWLDACMDNVAPLYAYASNDVAPKVLEDQRLNENGVMRYGHGSMRF